MVFSEQMYFGFSHIAPTIFCFTYRGRMCISENTSESFNFHMESYTKL